MGYLSIYLNLWCAWRQAHPALTLLQVPREYWKEGSGNLSPSVRLPILRIFDGQIGDGKFGVIGKHENVGDTSDSSSGISIDAETSSA